MAKKYVPPKSMNDLCDLFYGDNTSEINRYDKFHRNPANSISGLNQSEKSAKDFMSKLGRIVKINEDKDVKKADFIIPTHNLIFEVKSINTEINERIVEANFAINLKNENAFIEKINYTLSDICKKEVDHTKHKFLGIIYIDFIQHNFTQFNWDDKFIRKTNLCNERLDGLLILFAQTGGNIKNKNSILFTKNDEIRAIFNPYVLEVTVFDLNCPHY